MQSNIHKCDHLSYVEKKRKEKKLFEALRLPGIAEKQYDHL